MGGSSSRLPPPPPVVVLDPYPSVVSADGISLSQAEKCNECSLEVDTNITVASVILKREIGDIQEAQCQAWARDIERVSKSYMSLTDLLNNLRAGKYAFYTAQEPVGSGPTATTQGYCQMISITDEDAEKVKSIVDFAGKLNGGRIRKVSGTGGFSSGTKARFIPSIPFKMSFAATKVSMTSGGAPWLPPKKITERARINFSITQLAIYYPSPIRVDSIQADAMLALNDPSDPTAKGIVLIPLRATNSGQTSSVFINRIARYIQSVQEADPDTGVYPETTIQTGADWSLGKMFTLDKPDGAGGVSKVKNGFFTWTGVAGYERYQSVNNSVERRYSWRPIAGLSAPQYFLLDSPLDINSSDLAQITRNLDVTPAAEANHPIPAEASLVFHKGSQPPAPDTISGKGTCGSGNLCEGYTNGSLDDVLKGKYDETLTDPFEATCPGARCDPFLQNAKKASAEESFFTPGKVLPFLLNLLVVVGMTLGAYIAMNMVGNDYDMKLRDVSEQFGQVLAVWFKNMTSKVSSGIGAVRAATDLTSQFRSMIPGRR